jgi:hypothetical protein
VNVIVMHMGRSVWLAVGVALLLTTCGDAPSIRDAPSASEPGVFFPTQPVESGSYPAALFRGPLLVRDRCVLIGGPGDYSLPIWRKGFTADRDESGRLIVLDGEGEVVAVEGEAFEMGGGYRAEFYPGEEPREMQVERVEDWLGYSIPERCLTDVYGVWIVGEI